MAEDCYRAYNLIKNWISSQSVIKIHVEYMLFDAVFHALSESGIKKMEDNFLGPFFAKILVENSIFLSVPRQYIHSL